MTRQSYVPNSESSQARRLVPKNYTLEEAAEFLRLSKDVLYKYRREIGGAKLGRRWVFSETELTDWLESKRHKPLRDLKSA